LVWCASRVLRVRCVCVCVCVAVCSCMGGNVDLCACVGTVAWVSLCVSVVCCLCFVCLRVCFYAIFLVSSFTVCFSSTQKLSIVGGSVPLEIKLFDQVVARVCIFECRTRPPAVTFKVLTTHSTHTRARARAQTHTYTHTTHKHARTYTPPTTSTRERTHQLLMSSPIRSSSTQHTHKTGSVSVHNTQICNVRTTDTVSNNPTCSMYTEAGNDCSKMSTLYRFYLL